MAYTTILFDIDNTLIDSLTLSANTMHDVVASVAGLNIPATVFKKYSGLPGLQIFNEVGLNNGATLLNQYGIEFNKRLNQLMLFDGIEETMIQLQQREITTGIVTSKNRQEFTEELQAFPMIINSKISVTTDDTKLHKPNGAPIRYAITHYQLDYSHILYVGDTSFDLQAAQDAGIDFAAAGWSASITTDFSTANYVLKQPTDLLALI